MAISDEATGKIASPPTVIPPDDPRVYVCRRVETSGTQVSYEMFFLGQRCSPDVQTFAAPNQFVSLGIGTSNVKDCLAFRDDRKSWAVGMFSTENVPDLKTDKWRFIKVDGIAPTLLNTFNGHWPFFVEQTFQWLSKKAATPLTGWKLPLVRQIASEAAKPEILRDLNGKFRHAWGDGGVMSLNSNGFRPPIPRPDHPVTAESLRQNPVLALTRSLNGASNTCNPPLPIYPTAAVPQ
jgi:hypothetical protein